MQTLERGDIESVNFGGHNGKITEVRGYQNYNITDNEIFALNNPTGKRPWVDTKIKSDFFINVFRELDPKTYADFGSNLGYYVFWAAQHGIYSLGIDYNPEYIAVCDAIKARHNIEQATFLNSNLQNSLTYVTPKDFMTVFNVIHHLYNRTEQYMDMERLVGDFATMANDVLFEVPTENDPKGHKWTMDSGYTEELFLSTAKKIFDTVERIDGQTEHRPYYLCCGSKLV
jgi:hypothetical protein